MKDYHYVMMPVCRNSHWTLLVANPRDHSVTVLDSIGLPGTRNLRKGHLLRQWRSESHKLSKVLKKQLSHRDLNFINNVSMNLVHTMMKGAGPYVLKRLDGMNLP